MIEPRYSTLSILFADRVFRIPKYQRFYSWESKQLDDLFSDLKSLGKRGTGDPHFMATIVCFRTSEMKPVGSVEYRLYDIVDGQQRLTTLILILKSIQIRLGDNDAEERDLLSKLIVKADGNLVLLQTNNANEHILNSFLRDGKQPTKGDLETQADRNLYDGIRKCSAFVEEWRNEKSELLSLLRLIKNRLGFVVYDTENERVVYSLFEILNSRGLPVDSLDKCKSMLMGQAYELGATSIAAEAAVATLHNTWGSVYRAIADVTLPGEQIIRVLATLRHGASRGKPRAAEEALELLRGECTTPTVPEKLSNEILDVSQRLVTLEKNKFLGPVTRILHARILAVAIGKSSVLSESERKHAMDQWERVTFRIFGLFGKDARSMVGDYIRLAEKILNQVTGASRYSEIMDSLRTLGKGYPIAKAVVEGLEGKNAYEDDETCRYILWRYEEYLAKEAGQHATVDEHVRREIWQKRAVDSIEHIFPQTPEAGGAWEGKMCRTGEPVQPVENHVSRIGNLVLLPIELNEDAKRRGFSEKKEIYRQHQLRMLGEVVSNNQWTLSEIETREKQIIQWAMKEWDDLKID